MSTQLQLTNISISISITPILFSGDAPQLFIYLYTSYMPTTRWQAIIFTPYYSETTLIYAPVGKHMVNIHIYSNAHCVIFKDLYTVGT